jgi:hypothetical protein
MKGTVTFLAGMIVGSAVLATAGPVLWTVDANEKLSHHSGVHFTEVKGDPCIGTEPCVDHLRIHVAPALHRPEVLAAGQRHADPDFRAVIGAAAEGESGSLVLQILHPDSVTLLGPGGQPAALCAPPLR